MLLSRLAENVYWTGRYLERAEATARLVKTHTELYLDLPRAAGMTFTPLLAVTGSEAPFAAARHDETEEEVVRFLAADAANPGSVLSALGQARDNMRATRTIFPREAWEVLNLASLRSGEQAHEVTGRHRRLRWLEDVIADVQRLTGLLAGSMSHDEAYAFLRIGRNIERADMTTRVLDVRSATLLASRDEALRPYADLQWMSILRSLTAYQAYRRRVHNRVQGPDALRFLLQDPQFPRSVAHCLDEIGTELAELPDPDAALAMCAEARAQVANTRVRTLAWDGLHEFVDELQVTLGRINDTLTSTYFRPTTADVSVQVQDTA